MLPCFFVLFLNQCVFIVVSLPSYGKFYFDLLACSHTRRSALSNQRVVSLPPLLAITSVTIHSGTGTISDPSLHSRRSVDVELQLVLIPIVARHGSTRLAIIADLCRCRTAIVRLARTRRRHASTSLVRIESLEKQAKPICRRPFAEMLLWHRSDGLLGLLGLLSLLCLRP